MKIETEQQRKEFLQEAIDRILYLPSDEKEKFVSVMVSSFRKFTPMYRIEQGETRVYQKVKN